MKKGMILTFLALLGIILILPNFLSCDLNRNPAKDMIRNYTISGIIRDKVSNQPIDSAWVYWDEGAPPPRMQRSDSTGKYITWVFLRDSERQGCILAGKEGYESSETTVDLSNQKGGYVSINIYLKPVQ